MKSITYTLFSLIFMLLFIVYASAFKKSDAEAIWTFDEGNGAVVKDYSGKGHNGEIQGKIQWTDGVIGKALQFPGTDADTWVTVPHSSSLNLKDFSITAWVKLTDNGNYHCILSKVEPRLVENYAAWSTPQKVVQIRFSEKGAFARDNGKAVIVDDTWHHIAGTFDSKSFKYYVDGKIDLEFASALTPDNNPGPVLIGAYPGSGTAQQYPAKGTIDEVGLFRIALSADEINKIFRLGLIGSSDVTSLEKLPATWGYLKDSGMVHN